MKSKLQRRVSHCRRAFTLIELLVVIAIIAILAAILFPVFGAVREQTRQSNTLSNLHSVYLGARLFSEDEGRYPSSLFGYAETPVVPVKDGDPVARPAFGAATATPELNPTTDPITPMDKSTQAFTAGAANGINRGYLYREQVKDFVTFVNADNPINDKSAITEAYYPRSVARAIYGQDMVKVVWRIGQDNGTGCSEVGDKDIPYTAGDTPTSNAYAGHAKLYYKMDSADVGPMLDDNGKQVIVNGVPIYELHYAPDWTHLQYRAASDPNGGCELINGLPVSTQLKYKSPPTERTVLTYVTQHTATTGSPSVIMLLLSGTARKVNYKAALYDPARASDEGYSYLPLHYR